MDLRARLLPGQGPWGVYVGAYAFTAYDLDTYDDYDGDYAFVAVHNGFALASEREVVKSEFAAWAGDKWIKHEEIKKEEYDAGFDKYGPAGPYWSKDFDVTPEKVAHNYPGQKVLTRVEVTEASYAKAPKDTGSDVNGEQYVEDGPTPISQEEYKKLLAEKGDGKFLGKLAVTKDANGVETAWFKTSYYLKQWVKSGTTVRYFRDHYILGIAKDLGRLGDVVGGQGFAWNQPLGQQVTAFGYPSAPTPTATARSPASRPSGAAARPVRRAFRSTRSRSRRTRCSSAP
ncbi:hypothetical protein ACFQYP_61295 [Nonomuraea antimicrobica]